MNRHLSLAILCPLLIAVCLTGCQRPFGNAQQPFFNGGPLFTDNFGPTGTSSWWRDGRSLTSGAAGIGNNGINPWWQTANANRAGTNQNLQANGNRPWWEQGNLNNVANNPNANGFGQPTPAFDPRQAQQQAQTIADLNRQVQDLNSRLGRFDNVNNGIETEVASWQQRLQVATDHNYQLRQQLADSAVQVQQLQNTLQQTQQQTQSAEQRAQIAENQARQVSANAQNVIRNASTQSQNSFQNNGTPTIRANNSLLAGLPSLRIGGVHARMDGDVIRVEIPSDPLFVPGTFQIQQTHQNMLSQVAQAIRQNFPNQVVGVEAHWDNTPIQPATTTHHQLTATQALSVFDFMKRLGVPEQQMFTMAMGSNRPKYSSASGQDRRVDIVIYPETFNRN